MRGEVFSSGRAQCVPGIDVNVPRRRGCVGGAGCDACLMRFMGCLDARHAVQRSSARTHGFSEFRSFNRSLVNQT